MSSWFFKKNKINKVQGNNNTIVQIINSFGKEETIEIKKVLKKYLEPDFEEIEKLKEKISFGQKNYELSEKVVAYQEKEVFDLKNELALKKQEIIDKEKQLNSILYDLNGRDFRQISKIQAKAYEAFLGGNLDKALSILKIEKLSKQTYELLKVNEEYSDLWLLRAKLLFAEGSHNQIANCITNALKLNPSPKNYFTSIELLSQIKCFSEVEKHLKELANRQLEISDQVKVNMAFGWLYYYKNKIENAVLHLTKAKEALVKLSQDNCGKYLTIYAKVLTDLGEAKSKLGFYKEAECLFLKSLENQEPMSKIDSENDAILAMITLNNLGNLFYKEAEFKKAKKFLKIAIEVVNANKDIPSVEYLRLKGLIFRNLGNVERELMQSIKAENALNSSLTIFEELVNVNPGTFLYEYCYINGDLGVFFKQNGRLTEAKQKYIESVNAAKTLASIQPETYLPLLAINLNNYGNLLVKTGNLDDAYFSAQEALEIRQRLFENEPRRYAKDLVVSHINLSNINIKQTNYSQAEENLCEAIKIADRYFDFRNKDSVLKYAGTKLNIAFLYQEFIKNKELSIKNANETIDLLRELEDLPLANNQIEKAFGILRKWQ
ncbi:tetratricopeptide repeat protein [Flagellimonas beolgyonensis]|uniref:tetratricopeptide repeat protein n=1 Tax=Flagellimonas beolgyonensis TaxID=864064 RepID=UPI000F8E043A|nr:tetratricopeptide repeat protein [Allomuricauda beolgyonensis]